MIGMSHLLTLCVSSASLQAAVELPQGGVAPFAGELLDLETAARLVTMADAAGKRCALGVRQAEAQTLVEKQRGDALDAQLQKRGRDFLACDAALQNCRQALQAERRGWWTSLLWGATGIFVGGAVGLTVGWMAHGL